MESISRRSISIFFPLYGLHDHFVTFLLFPCTLQCSLFVIFIQFVSSSYKHRYTSLKCVTSKAVFSHLSSYHRVNRRPRFFSTWLSLCNFLEWTLSPIYSIIQVFLSNLPIVYLLEWNISLSIFLWVNCSLLMHCDVNAELSVT